MIRQESETILEILGMLQNVFDAATDEEANDRFNEAVDYTQQAYDDCKRAEFLSILEAL